MSGFLADFVLTFILVFLLVYMFGGGNNGKPSV